MFDLREPCRSDCSQSLLDFVIGLRKQLGSFFLIAQRLLMTRTMFFS